MVSDHPRRTLLVIDDDKNICRILDDFLASESLDVQVAHTIRDGLKIVKDRKIDVVLLDQKLPDGEGDTICRKILDFSEETKIIFITAYPSFEHAVRALKAGAYDYLSKPVELDELRLALDQALRTLELERFKQFQFYQTRHEIEDNILIGNFGSSPDIPRLVALAAANDSPLLITGETGTGKNVVARAIHFAGTRSSDPFVSLNCSALPESLIEAELFGYEKGAFTGACAMRKGIFEIAEGGTLLLDEIGAMPLHLQSKLLGVLDDGRIRRVGGHSQIPVHVRIMASTNAVLETVISQRIFREDLFYRLSVLRIHLPPLRQRVQDIPDLCRFFIKKITRGRVAALGNGEPEKLMAYSWPGNIRELRNIIERSIILHQEVLYPSELLARPREITADAEAASQPDSGLETLAEIEKEHIRHMLTKQNWNLSRTAKALEISLSTLKRKVRIYGLNKKRS